MKNPLSVVSRGWGNRFPFWQRRFPFKAKNPDRCLHRWQPVQMVLETGGFQPDLEGGKVYLVCLKCASHTYMETAWAGVRMLGSLDRNPGQWEAYNLRLQYGRERPRG